MENDFGKPYRNIFLNQSRRDYRTRRNNFLLFGFIYIFLFAQVIRFILSIA